MRRRRDLTGWLLMAILFIASMALIFYILLMRAQHLGGMEQRRTDPQSYVLQLVVKQQPLLTMHPDISGHMVPHYLAIEPALFVR